MTDKVHIVTVDTGGKLEAFKIAQKDYSLLNLNADLEINVYDVENMEVSDIETVNQAIADLETSLL